MIRTSVFVAAMAITLSLMLHLLGLSLTAPRLTEKKVIESRANSLELSTAFEEFVDAPPEQVQPEQAEVPEPSVDSTAEPEPAEVPTSDVLVASPEPQDVPSPDTGTSTIIQPEAPQSPVTDTQGQADDNEAETAEPVASAPVTPDTSAEAPVEATEAAAPVAEPVAELPTAKEPEEFAALPPPQPLTVPVENQTVVTETPDVPVAPITPEDTEGSEEDAESEQAVVSSLRPRLPDRRPRQTSPSALDPSRNFDNLRFPDQTIDSPLTVYRREGLDTFRQDRGGNRSGGLGPGNSDRTNYAGQVLVHLNRAPLVYVATRGFAQVFFEINPDGTLAWVDVVDSSGAPDVERAAKEQVRSAAPFPRPPGGVSRKLSFFYQIR
ncbi:energy transducer TonB family protein [Ruegeria arenilitoris]|uniref:energy transducer TonB family protein n=1 Tax=Ruegeria arenilitoris TaxID=1173585 RepID=UPI0014818FF7|nr:energy transducer TonB [Ruegeria arenilitoris]